MSNLSKHIRKKAQRLPKVPALQKCSESVFMVLGMNPGPFSLTGTNTYLVGKGKSRVLIDTGEGKPEYLTNLMEGMKACGCERISDIIVTHWHIDHLGGVPSLMDRFDHEIRVHKFMPERKEKLFGGEGSTDPYKIWPEDKFVPLKDGQIFRVDEENTLRIMHTPGHANDHVTLFHEEEKAIFTADNVLGVGTSVFRNLADYMDSLKKMERVAREHGVRRLYPSHGPILDDKQPGETITAYIKHRTVRIDQVRAVLERGGEFTTEEVTRIVYPKDKYPEHLILAAMGNTHQVLLKLCRDGIIESTTSEKWRVVEGETSHL